MAVLDTISSFFFAIILFSIIGGMEASTPVKGAYWPSWKDSDFSSSSIDTTLFTHIYYSFLQPSKVTYKLEIPDSSVTFLSDFTTTLHNKNPSIKTLISCGGGGSDSELFALIASDSNLTAIFVNSTIDVARKYGFDGIDLDWEYPKTREEMNALADLLKRWRDAIRQEAEDTNRTPLLLTAAVYFTSNLITLDSVDRIYPIDSVSQNLDLINVMSYDYKGSWDTSATGAPAALYAKNSNVSTSYGLKSWIEAGMPAKKMAMGLPLYGKTWTLKDPSLHEIGSPAVGVGPGDDGTMIYSEVLEFNENNNAAVVYDTDTVSTYSYAGTTWIGYDDSRSTTGKIGFAKNLGLGGYFFWALGYDNNWEISTSGNSHLCTFYH
ncbi:hypothetical protein ACFE04_008936 [Oxalis oulophora]